MKRKYGDYELVRLIGKGGYGEVHLAVNVKTQKKFAIKMLDKSKIINENLEEGVIAEVQSMKLVNHPFIAKLFEVFTSHKKILLVMEYMEGGDLFDEIKQSENKRLPEEKARVYFQQIIIGVDYLHKKNIIHRDLKPENILIDQINSCIKITDFGLSTLIKSKDELIPDFAGTTDYLAPEVIKQTGYLGQQADIWSCGVILFNCVTGNKPFYGKTVTMLNSILNANVVYPETKMSSQLIDLLTKILDPNPKTRYNSHQIMIHPWFLENFKTVQCFLDEWYLHYGKDSEFILSDLNNNTINTVNTVNIDSTEDKKETYLNFNELNMISCFELAAILCSNNLNNMFLKNNMDKTDFKFVSYLSFNEALEIVYEFFTSSGRDANLTVVSKDKIFINTYYKNNNYQLILSVYKLSSVKFILMFSYRTGILTKFNKIMKTFFDKYKTYFKLF